MVAEVGSVYSLMARVLSQLEKFEMAFPPQR
jgi:hypothetical protein